MTINQFGAIICLSVQKTSCFSADRLERMKMSKGEQAITNMLENDLWGLRVIARKSGLGMYRDLIDQSSGKRKELLAKAYAVELKVIKAAKQENQVSWDLLNKESKEIFALLKELV